MMSRFYKCCKALATVACRLMYNFKGIDFERIPKSGAAVLCCNHTSAMDILFLAICCRDRQLHFMGKKELFKSKLLSKLFYRLGSFPVDREGNSMGAIKKARKVLSNNGILCIFPEGTRSKNGKIGKGKAGAAMIALGAQVPIIPASIYREGKLKLFSKTVLRCGELISFETLKGKRLQEGGSLQTAIDFVMEKITALWEMGY